MVRLSVLCTVWLCLPQWIIPMTPTGIEPATFQLVAQGLKQQHHPMPWHTYTHTHTHIYIHIHIAPTKPSAVNRSNLLPLQYTHFNVQPLFTNCAYPWDTWNYIVSKVQHIHVKRQHWWCASHLICSTLPLSHNMTPVYKTLHTNEYWNMWL